MRSIGVLGILLLACVSALASESPAESAELERIEFERNRQAFEDAMGWAVAPPGDLPQSSALWFRSAEQIAALGDAALPFLEAELGSSDPWRRSFARFALSITTSPGAVDVLEAHVDALRETTDRLALYEKAWSCVALAIHGRPDAIGCMEDGTSVSSVDYVSGYPSLVAATVALGSVARGPLLEALAHLDAETDAEQRRAATTLVALARIPDPSLLAVADKWLRHPGWGVRSAAVALIAAVGNADAVGRLIRLAVEDPDTRTRVAAASAIEQLRPAGIYDRVLVALEASDDPYVRGALYRVLAATDPERAVEALRSHRGRDDPNDRRMLLHALGATHSPRALNLLREGLRDPDPAVSNAAVLAIAEIPSPGAIDTLLAVLRDARHSVSQTATVCLVALEESRAAPRIADVLIRETLTKRASLLETRELTTIQTDALLRLRYTEPAEELVKRAAAIEDPEIRGTLERTARLMREMQERGTDVAKWTAAAASSEPPLAVLALERLGEIATPQAAAALVQRFEATTEHRAEVVAALARTGQPAGMQLLRRIVLDPEFDLSEGGELRAWAAWGLRRIGSPEARGVLRDAVVARQGREFAVLAYFAVLAGDEAVPVLESVRAPRIRWQQTSLGEEQGMLERAIRDLRSGLDVDYLDDEPGGIADPH